MADRIKEIAKIADEHRITVSQLLRITGGRVPDLASTRETEALKEARALVETLDELLDGAPEIEWKALGGDVTEPKCSLCGAVEDPQAVVEGDDPVCSGCLRDYLSDVLGDTARNWARKNVRVVSEVAVYDPQHHFAPSPDDYEAGNREAHTMNSVQAHNRHEATNYEEILALLDRADPVHHVIYAAVRERADELVGAEADDG